MFKTILAGAVFSSISLLATPAQVIIIRHGEKPPVGNALDPQGEERANALPIFFQTNPLVLDFGFPVAVFAFRPASSDSSIRGIQTITPTADSFGLAVHSPYSSSETTPMAQFVLSQPQYDGKMVLICWEHNNMANLVTAFGAPTPPAYPGSRFDLVYKITFTNPSSPTFCCGLQELMFDDSNTLPAGFTPCP